MHDVLCLILGGGRGTRLYPLTKLRSKPAVPVAGKYRLIDIPISNCINSGLNRVYVLTQFLSVSLHRHISHTYKFDPFSRGFVEILAAQQTNEATTWYQGTADAVRQQLRYVQEDRCSDVLVLSGDQLYRMDFGQLVKTHRDSGADATIAVLPVAAEQTSNFGILRQDESGCIVGFVEKPKNDAQRATVRTPPEWLEKLGIPSRGREYLASMGIYCFKREVLIDLLTVKPLATDFGKDIFPRAVGTHHLQTHVFDGYWEDLGTVKSYHEANLALTGDQPPFDFHSPEGVIYTRMRFLPASRISGAEFKHCLISDGCIVHPGAHIERCLLGVRSHIGRNARLTDTIIIGADRFETDAERTENHVRSIPDFTVGEGSIIERAIVDKDCRIGRDVRIINRQGLQEADAELYVIRDGIVVIPKGTVIPDGTVI
jgi:glucose-1-phosphate adenylyltransferase